MDLPEWAQALPEELHSAPFLKDAENLNQFVERIDHAAKHMGNSVRIPGPDANEEAWAEFDSKLKDKIPDLVRVNMDDEEQYQSLLNRLGRPEDAKGYEAGDEYDWLASAAHESGLTKKQFAALVDKLGTVNQERQEQTQLQRQEALDELYQEWGLTKSKKMDAIIGLAKLTKAPEAFVQQLEDGKADPDTMRWMADLASKFSEAQNFIEDKNEQDTITPTEARARIQELLDSGKLFDASKPDVVRAAQNEMVRLQALANPGASKDMTNLTASSQQIQEMFEQS